MNGRRITDVHLAQALRAHLPDRAQPGLRQRVIDRVETTQQQRPLPSLVGRAMALGGLDASTGRVRTNRWAMVLAAAAVLALIVASAIFVGRQRPSLLAITPTPTATPTSTSTAPPTPSATTTPTPTATAEVTPPAVSQSPVLTWTKVVTGSAGPSSAQVAWLGDRFVFVDQTVHTVSTSTDGAVWHLLQPGDPDPGYADLLKGSFVSWQDQVVGWWNPEDGPDIAGKPPITARDVLRIIRPPGAATVTTPWKGRINSIGIGPAGIVAEVHSDLDWDAWVTKKLGARSNNAWVTHLKGVDYSDGILQIKLDNGPGLKVVWAADGRAPGDYQDKGFAWYSPDGEQWTAISPVRPPLSEDDPTFPMGSFGGVVGVSDGFIAGGDADESKPCPSPDGCEGMWHSSDGLTWRNIANVPYGSGPMLPWMGGALVTDGVKRFDVWTSQGRRELPMAAGLPAPSKQPNPTSGTGPLGLVTVLNGDKKLIVTRDGVDWDIQPMPAAMAADAKAGLTAPTVAVGDGSVLLVWSGNYENGYVPSIWRGAPAQ